MKQSEWNLEFCKLSQKNICTVIEHAPSKIKVRFANAFVCSPILEHFSLNFWHGYLVRCQEVGEKQVQERSDSI